MCEQNNPHVNEPYVPVCKRAMPESNRTTVAVPQHHRWCNITQIPTGISDIPLVTAVAVVGERSSVEHCIGTPLLCLKHTHAQEVAQYEKGGRRAESLPGHLKSL